MINGKKIVCIIPARLQSTRLPEKPLKLIHGLPMIVHTYKRAKLCKDLDEVYIATDSEKIKEVVEKYGGKVIMTSEEHKTGTDRIGEAVKDVDCDIVVNVQGDEPLVHPDHISAGIKGLLEEDAKVSCLCTESDQIENKNEIKIVLGKDNNILYLSRSDIPSRARVKHNSILKQYCIYAFEKEFLLDFVNWEQTPLEKIESIELLRALERGYKIKGVKIESGISQSVDTEEDLELVEKLMEDDKLKDAYLN